MFCNILIVYVNISVLLLKILIEIFLIVKYKQLKKIFSFFNKITFIFFQKIINLKKTIFC